MARKQLYNVYISVEHKTKLKIMAAYQNTTMGAIVESMIDRAWENFNEQSSTSEHARTGSIGCGEDEKKEMSKQSEMV